jgi:xylan 1,4-beta-xylosidase
MRIVLIFILLVSATMATTAQKRGKQTQPQNRVIQVDVQNVIGPFNTMYKECVGAGRANEGLRADWQQQLAITKAECGFKYIRFHGLFTDDMGIYRINEKGQPQYNYQYVDVLFDYILSIGMKPFVELGFMPKALASGDKTIFWWEGNVTPPNDYNRWEDLVRNITQHWTNRYGADEVKSWYFEVWNEPNLTPWFWTGTMEEYFKLYAHSATAVKSVNAEYRVGGPGTAGAAWEPELIDFCVKNNLPIDFVSTHAYGVNQGFLDEYGNTGTVLAPQVMAVSSDVLQSRKEISESARPNLELHYTEWSASYTPSDPIHDSYHEAAYILLKLKQIGTAANSMSYWVFTDIFEEAGPRFTPFHGGFGLMNTQGIKKAAYHAYSFLNKMGNTELVNADTLSWATKNNQGDIQVLLWDFTYTLPTDSVNNQDYYIKDLPSKSKGKVTLNLSSVPQGNYQLQVYKIGYNQNDPHTAYTQMGRPNQLTQRQVEFLKSVSTGAPTITELVKVPETGKFTQELNLNENDVYLVRLNKL